MCGLAGKVERFGRKIPPIDRALSVFITRWAALFIFMCCLVYADYLFSDVDITSKWLEEKESTNSFYKIVGFGWRVLWPSRCVRDSGCSANSNKKLLWTEQPVMNQVWYLHPAAAQCQAKHGGTRLHLQPNQLELLKFSRFLDKSQWRQKQTSFMQTEPFLLRCLLGKS